MQTITFSEKAINILGLFKVIVKMGLLLIEVLGVVC